MKPFYRPICHFCKHFYSDPSPSTMFHGKCLAFPDGIPNLIIRMDYDHREPYPGDNDAQFEKYERRETLHVDLWETPDEVLQQELENQLRLLSEWRKEGAILPPFISEDPRDNLRHLKRVYKKFYLPPDDSEDPRFWEVFVDETIYPAWLLEALMERTENLVKNSQYPKDGSE